MIAAQQNNDFMSYPLCDLDCEDIHALMLQTLMSYGRKDATARKTRFMTY